MRGDEIVDTHIEAAGRAGVREPRQREEAEQRHREDRSRRKTAVRRWTGGTPAAVSSRHR